jgi:hypothetical protein
MYKSWMWKQRSYREQFQGAEGGAAAGGTATPDDQNPDQQQAEGETLDADQQADQVDQQAEGDGEVVVTIGDEAPAANDDGMDGRPAPQWLKDMRKRDREQAKRIRELEQAEAARQAAAAPAVTAVGEKPTPDQFDFDSEAYGDALLAWNDRKKKADDAAAAARTEQETAQAAFEKRIATYNTAKAALKVADFDDAEHVVRETMSQTQIGVLLNGADKPELVVYALGRNPAKAKELAAIKDPIKFAFAVAKVETQLKVAPKNTPPAPERQVRGTAGGVTGVDNELARLQAEADKSGDRSKVAAYIRQRKNAA